MKKNKILENKYCIISAILIGFLTFFYFYINNFAPFGDGSKSILTVDLYHQYAPFLGSLIDKVQNGGSIFFSFGKGFAVNFLGNFINYLASPFNILVVLLGKENLHLSVQLIIILKTALAGFTFSYALKKLTNTNGINLTIFSIMYTLGSFFMSYYWNIMWLDAIYVLPILVYSVNRLIEHKKIGLYTLTLTYAIITNYYMGYMLCIASVISFLYFFFSEHNIKEKEVYCNKNAREKNMFLSRGIIFAITSIFAALMSCIVLIPTLNALNNTSAMGDTIGTVRVYSLPMEFIANHFAMTISTLRSGKYISTLLPNIYCGVLTILLIPFYFLSKNITKKEKITSGSILLFFFFSLTINVLDYFWHAFSFPNDIPFRFGYIYVFFLLLTAYKGFIAIKDYNKKNVWIVTGVVAGLALIIGILWAPNKSILTIPLTISTMLIYGWILSKKTKSAKKILNIALCVLIIFEMSLPYVGSLTSTKSEHLFEHQVEYNDAVEIIKNQENDNGFYNIELLRKHSDNELTLFGANSISAFSSMNYNGLSMLHKYMGANSNALNSQSYSSMPATYDMIFGIKYIVDNDTQENRDPNSETFEKIGETSNGFSVYKNKYTTGIGFATLKDLSETDAWKYNTYSGFENQNNFFASATNVDDILIRCDETSITNEKGITATLKDKNDKTNEYNFKKTEAYSADTEQNPHFNLTTTVNENGRYYVQMISTEFDLEINSKNINPAKQSCTGGNIYIVDVGYLEKGDTITSKVMVSPKTPNEGKFNYFVYRIDNEKVKEAYDAIEENGILQITKYDDASFTATINSKTNYIYTNVPYDTNWDIYIDGQLIDKNDILKIANSNIGLKISQGEHTIEFKYHNNSLLYGAIFSSVSLIGFIIFYLLYRRRQKNVV